MSKLSKITYRILFTINSVLFSWLTIHQFFIAGTVIGGLLFLIMTAIVIFLTVDIYKITQ